MDPVSLTDFVDFVTKVGSPKLTKVREMKLRGEYDPATDFWRALRLGIRGFHEGGGANKQDLDKIIANVSDAKKKTPYGGCIKGYKKFLGKKTFEWFEPPTGALWDAGGLVIRVNPEVGLKLDGVPHVIKLHFKKEKLAKLRVNSVLLLMEQAMGAVVPDGTRFAILDTPLGKAFAEETPDPALLPLLLGEAASLRAMWEQL